MQIPVFNVPSAGRCHSSLSTPIGQSNGINPHFSYVSIRPRIPTSSLAGRNPDALSFSSRNVTTVLTGSRAHWHGIVPQNILNRTGSRLITVVETPLFQKTRLHIPWFVVCNPVTLVVHPKYLQIIMPSLAPLCGNDHTSMTAPHPVCSVKLSMFGLG